VETVKQEEDSSTESLHRMTIRSPNEPGPIEIAPYTVFPTEFYVDSNTFVDI